MTYLHNSFDISVAFGIVDGSQLCCSLTVLVVALEDTTSTFTLASNNSSHICCLQM